MASNIPVETDCDLYTIPPTMFSWKKLNQTKGYLSVQLQTAI